MADQSHSPALAEQEANQIARPLRVLVPLIQEDLRQGKQAAETAGMPFYRAAGEKLHEAKISGDMSFGDLAKWSKRNFGIGRTQTSLYMSLADTTSRLSAAAYKPTSLNQFKRDIGHHRPTSGAVRRAWSADVDKIAEHARQQMERLQAENLTRQQEREADRKLALRLIDIGFKVLAKELHPDKGGSRDAMQRLGKVRDRLKAAA